METKEPAQFSVNDICNDFLTFAENQIRKKRWQIKENELAFTINKSNQAVIKKLCLYFNEHPEGTLNLMKGIYLGGSVGTGKTTLMNLFANWNLNKRKFRFISCREIQQEFATGGFESLLKYTKKSYKYRNNMCDKNNGFITYCFDDFGSEGRSKFYGNDVNVMEEIIQDRYREYEETGMLTHATSNLLSGEVIESIYGIRVRDRIRGMFNIIEMNGDSFR